MNNKPIANMPRSLALIATERLLLLKPSIEDAEPLHQLFVAETDVNAQLTGAAHPSLEDYCELIVRMLSDWETGKGMAWLVFERGFEASPNPIGIAICANNSGEGIALRKESRSKGYASEAAIGIMDALKTQPAEDSKRIIAFASHSPQQGREACYA